jgi:hypothetical protein
MKMKSMKMTALDKNNSLNFMVEGRDVNIKCLCL